MGQRRRLRLEPDCPRIRRLLAKKLGKSEDEVQAIREWGDLRQQVELVITIEELLEEIHR